MPKYEKCIHCNELFSKGNVFTEDGWRETEISGMCEKCFDEVCSYEDDEPEEDEE